MSETSSFDLIIIGGGPAGYVGAIRAAQLGMTVACVERDRLGGVCLNWGCIPTKALLANAELYEKLTHDAEKWGINAQQVSFNWEKVIGRSRGVADNLNRGIGALFKKHKITHILGSATITNAVVGNCAVRVALPDGTTSTLKSKNVLVSTGAAPRALPGVDFDGDKVITSKEAMTLKEQPKSLCIIGAGPIGMEFAYFYNAFGTKVTVIEMLDRLLPGEDAEVSKAVERSFIKQGILCKTSTKTNTVRKTDTGVELCVAPTSDPQHVETITADKVLIAIGVKGKFDSVFSDTLLPKLEVF
jgi:dihydrolipoamide dehydrogenase